MIRSVNSLVSQLRLHPVLPILLAVGLLPAIASPAFAQAPPPCLATFTSPLFVPVTGALTELIIDDQCEHVYLTNATNNTVEVFSLQTGTLQAPIQVGSSPTGLDTSPDGKTLYVANSGANNISVVDLNTRVEKLKVPVPAGFSNDTPFSLAVAKNGLVLFSTTFAGSGFGGRMLQLDPTSNTVSDRLDFFFNGSTTEATVLRASGDRSAVGAVAGDISSAPVFRYSADTNVFSPEKDLNGFVSTIALDRTGSTILVNPGTFVLMPIST
jgi:YVTN family beta-propeller protein